MKNSPAMLLLLILLSACSNEQLYSAVQGSQRMECSKLPPGQYQNCLADYDTTYREYQRDRQDLLRNTITTQVNTKKEE